VKNYHFISQIFLHNSLVNCNTYYYNTIVIFRFGIIWWIKKIEILNLCDVLTKKELYTNTVKIYYVIYSSFYEWFVIWSSCISNWTLYQRWFHLFIRKTFLSSVTTTYCLLRSALICRCWFDISELVHVSGYYLSICPVNTEVNTSGMFLDTKSDYSTLQYLYRYCIVVRAAINSKCRHRRQYDGYLSRSRECLQLFNTWIHLWLCVILSCRLCILIRLLIDWCMLFLA